MEKGRSTAGKARQGATGKRSRVTVPASDKIAKIDAKIDYHKRCIDKLKKTRAELSVKAEEDKIGDLAAMLKQKNMSVDEAMKLLGAH